jgi:hypothetical protein
VTDPKPVVAEREARARRLAEEGRKAREEHDALVEARDLNTARLRALRLEKERADAEARAAAAPVAAPRRKTRAKEPGRSSQPASGRS